MIHRYEVSVYIEKMLCDTCVTEMEQGSFALMVDPPIYNYACPKCGRKEQSREAYPRPVYELKDIQP